MTTDTAIRKQIFLKADRALVWRYLTEPEKLATWFHGPKTPLREGEDYAKFGTESGEKLVWGKVITARPPELLRYTFSIAPMAGAVAEVTWTLEEVPGGTRLTLLHEGLPEAVEAFDLTLALDKGWDGHLDRLRADLHAG